MNLDFYLNSEFFRNARLTVGGPIVISINSLILFDFC